MHAKRHPITLDVRAGCDADGVLTGLHVRAIGDSGAYASVGMKVLERAAGHVAGPYRWQSLDIEATAVRQTTRSAVHSEVSVPTKPNSQPRVSSTVWPNLQALTRGSFVART